MADASVGDVEQLVVLLSAQVSDFEKQIKKASDTAGKQYAGMRASSKSATAAMEKDATTAAVRIREAMAEAGAQIGEVGHAAFSGLLGAALPAAVGVLGVEQAIDAAKEALEQFDEIGKSAKATGLSAEDFQAYAYAAQLGGVETNDFATAMENFARVSGQAEAGTGRLVSQLKKLDPVLLQQLQTATSQKQRLEDVANAFAKTTDAAQKSAIAQALFGQQGARMVEVLSGGADELDEVADKARAMGIVVSNDMIANAEEMNDKFTTATKILDTQFKEALVELAPLLVSSAQDLDAIAHAVATVTDSMQDISQRTMLVPLQNELVGVENTIASMKDDISSTQQWIDQQPDWNPLKGITQNNLNAKKTVLEQYYDQAAKLQDRIDQLQGMGAKPASAPPASSPPPPTGDTGTAEPSKIDRVTASLKAQIAALSETGRQQAEQNALARAGITINDKAAPSIVALADKYYDLKTAQQAVSHATGFFSQTLSSAFEGLVTGGESAVDVLQDVYKAITNAVIEAELLGQGPLAGILGTAPSTSGNVGGLFGSIASAVHLPGYADGTPNTGGQRGQPTGVVHGQEAVIPLPSGGRVPVQIMGTPAASGTSGGSETIQIINQGPPLEAKSATSRKQGGTAIKSIVIGPVKQAIADGSLDGIMGAAYGLKRRGAQ